MTIQIGLYLICQRYKFESESQHTCCLHWRCFAVFNMSKIQIWKRITTNSTHRVWQTRLYLICQRYKFESESQLPQPSLLIPLAVFNMSKIQIWKRITTCKRTRLNRKELYLICQRYKFESESQRQSGNGLPEFRCI